MESVGPGEGRITRFERVFCPAAIALAMAQDAVDDARVDNKGDDAHWGAAGAASQRVSLEKFPDQARPRAPRLPGEIGIVPIAGCFGGLGAGARGGRTREPAPVRVRAIKPLAVPPGVRNMRGDSVNTLQGIQRHHGGAGARVRGSLGLRAEAIPEEADDL